MDKTLQPLTPRHPGYQERVVPGRLSAPQKTRITTAFGIQPLMMADMDWGKGLKSDIFIPPKGGQDELVKDEG